MNKRSRTSDYLLHETHFLKEFAMVELRGYSLGKPEHKQLHTSSVEHVMSCGQNQRGLYTMKDQGVNQIPIPARIFP
jgi:hypothetical protein